MAHSQYMNGGQIRSAKRKRAAQRAKRDSLAAEAARLGITVEELRSKKFCEDRAHLSDVIYTKALNDKIRSWGSNPDDHWRQHVDNW